MLFTRCPDCETTFRITAEALSKAGGQVRCGRCACVFDAYAALRRRHGDADEGEAASPLVDAVGDAPEEASAESKQTTGAASKRRLGAASKRRLGAASKRRLGVASKGAAGSASDATATESEPTADEEPKRTTAAPKPGPATGSPTASSAEGCAADAAAAGDASGAFEELSVANVTAQLESARDGAPAEEPTVGGGIDDDSADAREGSGAVARAGGGASDRRRAAKNDRRREVDRRRHGGSDSGPDIGGSPARQNDSSHGRKAGGSVALRRDGSHGRKGDGTFDVRPSEVSITGARRGLSSRLGATGQTGGDLSFTSGDPPAASAIADAALGSLPAWTIIDERTATSALLRAPRRWVYASIAAAVLLAAQATHHFRSQIAGTSVVGPLLEDAYAFLGAEVTPHWDLEQYEIVEWVAIAEPNTSGRGSLKIAAQIHNKGPRAQPYPHVHVQLKDRWEDAIGSRVFKPSEYLPEGMRGDALMAPGITARAELDVVDPGRDAYGFELDVCVAADAQNLRCAADVVFR